MSNEYSTELPHAFIVKPVDLEKLVERMKKSTGEVKIRAYCIDETTREFNTVEELNAYENSKPKRIQKIRLYAESDDYSTSVEIVLGTLYPSFTDVVSIRINGSEDYVDKLRDQITEQLSGMRAWYSWLSRRDLFWGVMIAYFALYFILHLSVLFEWIPASDSPPSDSVEKRGFAAAVVLSFLVLAAAWGLDRAKNLLFPKIFFRIGQEESRFAVQEKVRWLVIGVVVSLVLSVIKTAFS